MGHNPSTQEVYKGKVQMKIKTTIKLKLNKNKKQQQQHRVQELQKILSGKSMRIQSPVIQNLQE